MGWSTGRGAVRVDLDSRHRRPPRRLRRTPTRPARSGNLILAIKWIASVLFFGTLLLSVVPFLSLSWMDRLFIAAVGIVGGLLTQWMFRPPVLRTDAREVAIPSGLYRQRMPRPDLALIVRGRAFGGYRGGSWAPAYFFVAKNGKPGLTIGVPCTRATGWLRLRSACRCRSAGTSACR